MYQVPVFISHSWSYCDHYTMLADWIFRDSWTSAGTPVSFVDLSVPKDNPIHFAPNADVLKSAIYERIYNAQVVVIPTGMYATHSSWISKEISGAKIFSKPILAVNPWAQERKSSIVINAADKYVGWNKMSVVQGVWSLSSYG